MHDNQFGGQPALLATMHERYRVAAVAFRLEERWEQVHDDEG
ncbi:MAG TPA: hypothetical protein VMW94_10700 [Actinomycetes bacterium]|nr:hypothetical protein [Actinomycetes bacterium]